MSKQGKTNYVTQQQLNTLRSNGGGLGHIHANKDVLDSITAQDLQAWSSAAENSHTHDNKEVLDTITQDTLTELGRVSALSHSHSNKIALDLIQYNPDTKTIIIGDSNNPINFAAYGEVTAYGPGEGEGAATHLYMLKDVPDYRTLYRGKYLRVKSDGSGTEWVDVQGGVTAFDNLIGRPSYNGVAMTSTTNIPEVRTSYWNGKQDAITASNKLSASLISGLATVATSGAYGDLSGKPTELSQFTADATHRLVTDAQITTWNGKQNALGYTPVNKAGDTITGTLSYNNGGSWILARDHCAVKTTRTSGEGSDWHPVVGIKTSAGFWSFGSVGGETLCFSHDTDSDYAASRNASTRIDIPLKAGTIALTSDIPTNNNQLTNGAGYITSSGSCAYASSAGNADTVDGEHASAFAHIGAHNNLTASGNEFTFASSGFSGVIWLNYRTASGTNGNITDYNFGNGKGGSLVSLSTLISQSSHGETAYNWGNHASYGYATQTWTSNNYHPRGGSSSLDFAARNINANGNIKATGEVAAYSSSDSRFKDNQSDLINPAAVLKALRPMEFNWNSLYHTLGGGRKGRDVGFIAQQVQPLIPSAIGEIYGGYLSLDYTRITPYLVAGWQSNEKRIEQLEREVFELKNELSRLGNS